jgi:predicted dehydrogenase
MSCQQVNDDKVIEENWRDNLELYMQRRDFIKQGSMAAGFMILPSSSLFSNDQGRVRVAYIGVGSRGRTHVEAGLLRNDVEVMAICDTQEGSLAATRQLFTKHGKKLPAEYTGGIEAFKKMLDRKDIDAVIISTPWAFHKEQSIYAMRAGIYVGCEVVAGITLEDHWDIAKVYEQTKVPYMTLENVNYRRDLLAVLNMVRQGIFGELVHLEGGYQHDLREIFFNRGEFGPQTEIGESQWRTQYNVDRDGDIYPTHGIGPMMNCININKGNRFTNLVSVSSKARGLSAYVEKVSPGNKNAKLNYKNGDVTTTLLNCANGETVVLRHDTHLPRPYSLDFRVQGTKGLWMDANHSIYIEGAEKNHHEWDSAEPWLTKYDHPLWKKHAADAVGAGHGGMDWFVFNAFIQAVKHKKQTPVDIYDSLTMSVITPLSEQSLKEGNKPQTFPDFTKGAWKNTKPSFALDDSGM